MEKLKYVDIGLIIRKNLSNELIWLILITISVNQLPFRKISALTVDVEHFLVNATFESKKAKTIKGKLIILNIIGLVLFLNQF